MHAHIRPYIHTSTHITIDTLHGCHPSPSTTASIRIQDSFLYTTTTIQQQQHHSRLVLSTLYTHTHITRYCGDAVSIRHYSSTTALPYLRYTELKVQLASHFALLLTDTTARQKSASFYANLPRPQTSIHHQLQHLTQHTHATSLLQPFTDYTLDFIESPSRAHSSVFLTYSSNVSSHFVDV